MASYSNDGDDHDGEMEVVECFLCMESGDGDSGDGDGDGCALIAPCVCRTYIHRSCLDRWRATSGVSGAMTHCPTCKTAYEYEEETHDTQRYRHEYYLQVVRRILLTLSAVFIGSATIWLIDRGTPGWMNLHWNAWNGKIYHAIGWDWCPPILVYFVCGLIAMLFIAGVVGIVHVCCCSRRNDDEMQWRRAENHHYEALHHDNRGRMAAADTDDPCQDCCCDCSGFRNLYCNDALPFIECGSCDGEACAVVCAFFILLVVIAGIFFLFMGIVGVVGNVVDRNGERTQRLLQTKFKRVKDLRPLSDNHNRRRSLPGESESIMNDNIV